MVVKSIMYVWFVSLCYICFVLASISAVALNITRGGRDKFTNPSWELTCYGFGADCEQSCTECQCSIYKPTFYQTAETSGQCVKNERIAVDENHSFLAHQYKRSSSQLCMVLKVSDEVTATGCHVTDVKQHWIWTKHDQLLNLYSLKCLQMSEKETVQVGRSWHPKVVLTSCDASDPRQIWKCGTGILEHLVHLTHYGTKYRLYYSTNYGFVIFDSEHHKSLNVWGRYGSNDAVCSQVSSYQGCYRYSDGSNMFTIETEAFKDCKEFSYCTDEFKNISAPIEATNQHCSIQWKKTEFLNYSQWDYLPASEVEEKQVSLVKLNTETLTLKVNLAASQHLGGQILRLYIRCENDEQGESETHCVLIKFPGRFKPLFSVHEMIAPTKPGPLETPTGSQFVSITIAKSTEQPEPSAGLEIQAEGSSSTLVIAIVVCVICLLLLAAGIILFLLFKRGRCPIKKFNQTPNDLSNENNTTHPSMKSAETVSNPVYALSPIAPTPHDRGPSDGYEMPIKRIASRSCELYEPGTETTETAYSDCALYEPSQVNSGSSDSGLNEPGTNENVYFEPDAVRNNSQPPASQLTYDYAKPDGVNLSSDNPLYEEA